MYWPKQLKQISFPSKFFFKENFKEKKKSHKSHFSHFLSHKSHFSHIFSHILILKISQNLTFLIFILPELLKEIRNKYTTVCAILMVPKYFKHMQTRNLLRKHCNGKQCHLSLVCGFKKNV